jgi:ankyrin repeat protein
MDNNDPDPIELWNAAFQGDTRTCERLLQTNHSVPGYIDAVEDSSGTTALICAVKYSFKNRNRFKQGRWLEDTGHYRQLKILRLLLAYGAKIECGEDPGAALHHAILDAPSNEYMHLLLNSPQNIDVDRKFNGVSPLMVAVAELLERDEKTRDQILALLLRGADVNTVDGDGKSILHRMYGADQWLVSLLKTFKVNFNLKDKYGRTPLAHEVYKVCHYSLRSESRLKMFFDKVRLLVCNGSDASIEDRTGRTAKQVAADFFPPDDPTVTFLQSIDNMMFFAMGTLSHTGHVQHMTPELMNMIDKAQG